MFTAGPQPQPSTPSVSLPDLNHSHPRPVSLPDLNHSHPRPVSLPDLNHSHPRPVFAAGPQHSHPRPVFAAGPQHSHPRPVSLPDLNHSHPRPVFAAGPQPHVSCISMNVFSLRLVQSWRNWFLAGQRHCQSFSSAAVNKDARDRQHPTARDSHDSF